MAQKLPTVAPSQMTSATLSPRVVCPQGAPPDIGNTEHVGGYRIVQCWAVLLAVRRRLILVTKWHLAPTVGL